MQNLNLLVAPDFLPVHFAGWHMFNTLLQKRLGCRVHLLMPGDTKEQHQLLEDSKVDLIYANPFDAAKLVREHSFTALARPAQCFDEVIISTHASHSVNGVTDLRPGCRIAVTPNTDVKLIALRLLEPADLDEHNVEWVPTESYQGVTRLLVRGEVDAGLYLAAAFHGLSNIARRQLKVLVESRLRSISHVFLANPLYAQERAPFQQVLTGIGAEPGDSEVLDALGMPHGLSRMEQEDAEFMIDLMETLLD